MHSEKGMGDVGGATGQAQKPFGVWMDEVQAAVSNYQQCRRAEEADKLRAREHWRKASEWEAAKGRHLKDLIQLMRERCGTELLEALGEVGQELKEEREEREMDDEDPFDLRYEVTPDLEEPPSFPDGDPPPVEEGEYP